MKILNITIGVVMAALLVGALVTSLQDLYRAKDRLRSIQQNTSTEVKRTPISETTEVLRTENAKPVVKNLVIPLDRTILLQGVVSENALLAAQTITELQVQSDEPIYLVLVGPGGSVLTGQTLIAAMQASRAPVYTICMTMCASMDAMIHQYGKKRYMTDRTVLMFHPASTGSEGDVDRIHSYTSFLVDYIGKIELDVANRWGVPVEKYKQITGVEKWIDSENALKNNMSDGTVSFQFTSYDLATNSDKAKQFRVMYPFRNIKQENTQTFKEFDIKWILKGY